MQNIRAMQILSKIRGLGNVPENEVSSGGLEDQPLDPALEKSVEGFFGFDQNPDMDAPPLTPFDALVSGMPGTRAENLQGFNIPKVPSFDEVVMSNPQLKLKIKKIILPLYDKAINYFEKRIVDLKQVLKQTGIPAKERIALQDLLEEFNQAKAEALIQKGVAEKAYADLVNIGRQEFIYRADLNGDRVIGYDLEDEKTLYVAQLPDGKEVIVNKNREPVFDPVFDDNYRPALAEQENLKLIDRADRNNPDIVYPEESPENIDEVLQVRLLDPNKRPSGPLGAQIHIVPPEGMWVRADEKGEPKIIKGKIGEERKLVPKKFELIEREDGKQMIGQNPPSAEERGKWVFVRINDLNISRQKLAVKGPNENGIDRSLDGGNVHFEFKGNVGNLKGILISRIAVQGYKTELDVTTRNDNANWVMASSVGVAISSGKTEDGTYTEHSSRIRYLNVDAAGLITTSKILPTKEEMVRYGIEDKFDAEGNFVGADGSKGAVVNDQTDIDRGNKAANYTLKEGWLATTKGADGSVEEDIWTRFGKDSIIPARQIFLPENTKYKDFRTGLISIDISGNITGTEQSDFIVTGLRQTEEIKKFLPIGTEEIPSQHPTYATVVDGHRGGGRDILISNGGDLYAINMTYVKRNSDRVEDQIFLSAKDGRVGNQAVYFDIGDAQPAEVWIDNSQDPDLNKAETDPNYERGTPDDWYQGPANSKFKFSQSQNDASNNIVKGLGDELAQAFTKARKDLKDFIDQNPMALAEGFNKSQFEIPEWIDKEDKNEGGFFEEFAVFNQEKDDSWQAWMNELSKE